MSFFHIAVIGKGLPQRTSSKGDVWHFQRSLIIGTGIYINVSLLILCQQSILWLFFSFSLLGETGCLIKGEAHPVNSSFITSDCSSQCICMVGGVASCMDLCPQMSPECPPGTALKEEDEPIGSGGVSCSCIRRYCVPAKGILVSLFVSTFSIGVAVSTALQVSLGIITISLPAFPPCELQKGALCNQFCSREVAFCRKTFFYFLVEQTL